MGPKSLYRLSLSREIALLERSLIRSEGYLNVNIFNNWTKMTGMDVFKQRHGFKDTVTPDIFYKSDSVF